MGFWARGPLVSISSGGARARSTDHLAAWCLRLVPRILASFISEKGNCRGSFTSCERGFVLRGGRSLFLAAAAAYRGLCTAPPLRVVKRVPRRERLRILNQAEPCMVLFRVACFPLVEHDKS